MTTQPPPSEPKPINFAFPFRDARGKEIVDEHLFHDWLAGESGGNFAVSDSGMWHGGIHVSADGAGKQLDLAHGVRCIADGEVVAYRINRTALTSQIAASGDKPAQTAQYSSAFTLVRHTHEFPANNRLVFFSLYMHLQSLADYQNKSMLAPPYWARAYEVTPHAADRPRPDPHRGGPTAAQVGLNIHAAPGDHKILGILPHGARVRIDERTRDGRWGRIGAIESGELMPPRVADVVQAGAKNGWVYLDRERGHSLLAEIVSETQCDQVVVLQQPVRINAGALIGHLGQYWLVGNPTHDNRMVHIEVFCDDALKGFLGKSIEASERIFDIGKRPLLRIGRGVKLFAGPSIDREGADAPETAVVQIYSQAALDALPADCKGAKDDAYGHGEPWWKVTSANSRYVDIHGWVRNHNMPPNGNVTLETPHGWKDFEMVAGSDAGNPTIFSTVDAWLDYVLCADKPATGDAGKLKPLACNVYRALSQMRTESQAADELRVHKEDKWLRFRASRLIPRHRSEWASHREYEGLLEKMLMRVAKEPYHDAELERIGRLMWWDEVQAQMKQPFPSSPDVFHIHPIALVGNFSCQSKKITVSMLQRIFSGASIDHLQIVVDELNPRLDDYKLDSTLRLSHFFAQIRQEAGASLSTSENLNYRSQVLSQNFSYFATYPDEAELYGKTATHAAQPEPIANRAYANKIGNGSVSSGDGWQYRGRGLKQLTGKSNYIGFQNFYHTLWTVDDVNFIENPDLVAEMRYAVRSAIYFWIANHLPEIADKGNTDNVVDQITAVINLHTDSYDARKGYFRAIWNAEIFGEVNQ
jgi:predicted chitinase